MLVLVLPRVSSRVSGFPVASPCLWGKLQNLSFSKVSKQVVMSFCVAGVALCDIPTCLITCRKSFCVAGAILLRRFHKMSCSFRGRRSILETLHSTLHIPHPLHFTLHTLHSTLYTLHFTLYTLHSALYTPHSTLHTPHFTLHTPHFTLYTPPSSIFHSLRCTGMDHKHVQDCSNKLFHKSVLRDCTSMCFDICTINMCVSIRVRGFHLVFSCNNYILYIYNFSLSLSIYTHTLILYIYV